MLPYHVQDTRKKPAQGGRLRWLVAGAVAVSFVFVLTKYWGAEDAREAAVKEREACGGRLQSAQSSATTARDNLASCIKELESEKAGHIACTRDLEASTKDALAAETLRTQVEAERAAALEKGASCESSKATLSSAWADEKADFVKQLGERDATIAGLRIEQSANRAEDFELTIADLKSQLERKEAAAAKLEAAVAKLEAAAAAADAAPKQQKPQQKQQAKQKEALGQDSAEADVSAHHDEQKNNDVKEVEDVVEADLLHDRHAVRTHIDDKEAHDSLEGDEKEDKEARLGSEAQEGSEDNEVHEGNKDRKARDENNKEQHGEGKRQGDKEADEEEKDDDEKEEKGAGEKQKNPEL
ncbi:hypothetical protein DIPPA_22828 [Diplonema papillatum]|nr:hypothetical protein DIPPA_22828 [Diplonema papillatum]